MQNTTIIQLPEKVKYILETIMEAGYEAYAVGGCIRDSILGRIPDDWDITTSADPYQIKELFGRTIDTGIKHGTVTVMLDKEGFEVTTYRIDGEYEDGRHPKEVTFTANLIEDLKRRDFTINAMAYNETNGLVDAFHGLEDMEQKVIRCVGCAKERFREDALRMMRAVRFSAQLGCRIEEETAKAMKELAANLSQISAERIQAELTKLVLSPHPEYLSIAYETGITAVVLPEFDCLMETEQKSPCYYQNMGEYTLQAMKEAAPERMLRFALLFHALGEEMTGKIMRRLKFDNEAITIVTKLVRFHDFEVIPVPANVRRAMMITGEEIFPLLLKVKKAKLQAQKESERTEKAAQLQAVCEVYEKVLKEGQCVSLKTLQVSGQDLIEGCGMKPGRELGEMLRQLLEQVIEEPERNSREWLLHTARIILKNK